VITVGPGSGFDVDAGFLEVETGVLDVEIGFLDVETGFVVEAGSSIETGFVDVETGFLDVGAGFVMEADCSIVTIFVDVDVGFRDVGFMGKGGGFHLSDAVVEGSIDVLWKSGGMPSGLGGMPWGVYGGVRATESDVEDAALVVMLTTRLTLVELVDVATKVEGVGDWYALPEITTNTVEVSVTGEGADLGAPGPSTTHDEVSVLPVLRDGSFVTVDRHETVVDTAGVA